MTEPQTVTKSTWDARKPLLIAFAVGLLVGPLLTGVSGFQVLGSTMRTAVSNAVVEQQANMCAFLAHNEVPDTSQLDYSARRKLADKYVNFPWDENPNTSAIFDCADLLSRERSVSAR